jgi:hypothetical protein
MHKSIRLGTHRTQSITKRQWCLPDQAQEGPEGTSKLHEKVPQVLWLPLLLHCLLSPSLHLWPHGKFPTIREALGLISRWLCMICRYHWKVGSCSTVALLLGLKDSGEGKSSQTAELEQ